MADTKFVVKDLISSLKRGKKGRLGRNYRINLVEFILCLQVPILLPFIMDISVNNRF